MSDTLEGDAFRAQPEVATERVIDIVMLEGPGPHSDFMEVESPPGTAIKFGEWVRRDDSLWALRFTMPNPSSEITVEDLAEAIAWHPEHPCDYGCSEVIFADMKRRATARLTKARLDSNRARA